MAFFFTSLYKSQSKTPPTTPHPLHTVRAPFLFQGRVPVFLDEKSNKKLAKPKNEKREARDVIFENEGGHYVAKKVGGYYGIRAGSKLAGILRYSNNNDEEVEKVEEVTWHSSHGKKECNMADFIKAHKCVNVSGTETDILVFEKPCTYCTQLVKVDTKDFGLPQTRQRCYLLVYKTDNPNDDLGEYYSCLVEHLKSPVKHSLEAFILDEDHEIIRRFREALLSGAGRLEVLHSALEADFWEANNNKDLAHNKCVRRDSDFEPKARFTTSWGTNGFFKVPHHWWAELIATEGGRRKDMLDILPMSSMRDAEGERPFYSTGHCSHACCMQHA